MMTASFTASVRLSAPPIACPDTVRELIHGKFMMVADPVTWKLASCERVNRILGAIGKGFEVELNVPLLVPLKSALKKAFQVPVSPKLSVYVPARVGPAEVPTIVTVSVPPELGKEIIMATFMPLTVPDAVIEASLPWH